MRILHVWDQAATASVIAKWQKKVFDHHTVVIKNAKHDHLKMTSYYGGIIINNKYRFVLQAVLLARKFDIIHLHDAWFMVVPLKILYPKKKIIMHYHGSLVRYEMKGKKWRLKWERLCDGIIVATTELLEFEYAKQPHYIPNPVDTDLFKPVQKRSNLNNALISLKKGQSSSRTLSNLLYHNISVRLDHIKKEEQVYYESFPKRLALYEYYVDIPEVNGKIIHANSVCGLQAMAMNLKVVNWDYTISESLPEFHRPENVVREIGKIYSYILK